MKQISRLASMKVVAVALVAAMALGVALPVLANHDDWFVQNVSCTGGRLTVTGFVDENGFFDDSNDNIYVNGVFLLNQSVNTCAVSGGCNGGVYSYTVDNDAFSGNAHVTVQNTGNDTLASTFCDDRVNENDGAPTIVYCSEEVVSFWKMGIDKNGKPAGVVLFTIPRADLLKEVNVKTLIKKVGKVQVWLMPDGRALLVSRQTDGKDYFMYFDPLNCVSLEEGAEWNVQ